MCRWHVVDGPDLDVFTKDSDEQILTFTACDECLPKLTAKLVPMERIYDTEEERQEAEACREEFQVTEFRPTQEFIQFWETVIEAKENSLNDIKRQLEEMKTFIRDEKIKEPQVKKMRRRK